jgi:microcystin-dependent protein
MAIDFPNSPTNGQLFSSGTITWVYDGSKWNIQAASQSAFSPIGTIVNYGGTSAPTGWLLCNGNSYNRTAYPNLFGIIGTTFGPGSSPGTTFNIPDFRSNNGNFIIRSNDESVVYTTTESLLAVPVGAMQLFAMSSLPTGWLRADGSAVSRTVYADLFTAIGTTYGSGDGSTTFNLPNIAGSGAGSPLYYIKGIISGIIQPSTVAHGSSHVRGGSDVVDGDRVQVDFTPAYYTRDSSPTEAGANTDLTAHLKGLDNRIQKAIAVSNINQTVLTAQPSIVNVTTYTDITGFAVTITPTFANSKILVDVQLGHGSPGNTDLFFRLLRGSTVINSGSGGTLVDSSMYGKGGDVYEAYHKTIRFLDSPATTSTLTYKVQWRSYSTGTFYLNRRGQDSAFSFVSSITVQEIPVW